MTKRHFQRPPLPWHGPLDALTACGLRVRPGMNVEPLPALGRMMRSSAYRDLIADGACCQTCAGRAGYIPTWDQDPVALLTVWLQSGAGSGRTRERVVRELRAVANVVVHHPDLYADEIALAQLAKLGGA